MTMSDRTGLGLVELALLDALDPERYLKCARVLDIVEERIGLALDYGYTVLVGMARPWNMPITLISGRGNFGSPGDDLPAGSRYTEARISAAGLIVLAAERGELAPVPAGLINGNTYGHGTRPPFGPHGIIAAIRAVIERPGIPGQALTELVGPPVFASGCAVGGDLPALYAGRKAELRLSAQVTVSADGTSVVITNIPPNISTDEVPRIIAVRVRSQNLAARHPQLRQQVYLPVADVRDEGRVGEFGRTVCVPNQDTPPEQLRELLVQIEGVYTTMTVKLPRPLPTLIRDWVKTHGHEDILASLDALARAIDPGQLPRETGWSACDQAAASPAGLALTSG
jgi:DNA gyrase/topoisomerase IV subunit A